MNSPTREEEEQAPSSQPTTVLGPRRYTSILWYQADTFLQEIENFLWPLPKQAQDSEARLRLLVERLPLIVEALRQAHDELEWRVTEGAVGLSEVNAVLKRQLCERAQAERRLAAEHAVARILAESTRLTDAAPKILQTMSQNLGWDVGALWIIDRDAVVLRCIEVWHTATVEIPAFEQVSRLLTFSAGIGLPGRVWASGSSSW